MELKIGRWLLMAVVLQLGVLAGYSQTITNLFTGSETNITLNPGTYDITVYGAQGGVGQFGSPGGLGAEMEGVFSFTTPTNLTLLVGGGGGTGPSIGDSYYNSGGGGGGSFVVSGTTPLIIAGGGGGGGGVGDTEIGGNGGTNQSGQTGAGAYGGAGGSDGSGGGTGTFFGNAGGGGGFDGSSEGGYYGGGGGNYLSGGAGGSAIYNGYLTGGFGGFGGGGGGGYGYQTGGGGGGYSGGGAGDGNQFDNGGGGGGGSYLDASVLTNLTAISGVASPDGSSDGEIIITVISLIPPPTIICPEPLTLLATNGSAAGTVQVGVLDTNGLPLEVVWTVDGIASQTNEIAAGDSTTESNVTFTAIYGLGEHTVVVSASNGQTAKCSTTVTINLPTPPTIICPEPLTLLATNGSAAGTVQVGVLDTNGLPLEVVWTVDGIASQTNEIAAGDSTTESNVTFTAIYGLGEHTVVVSASNGQTVKCSTTATINLPTPPTIICPGPLTLECTNGSATGTIQVGVLDTNGLPLEVVWTVDGIASQTNEIAAGDSTTESNVSFTANLGDGEHTVGVSVANGQTASGSTTVTVRDTLPPTILTVSAITNLLWPANHKLIPVHVAISAVDNCDSSVTAKITKVTCNNNKLQDPFPPDWIITGSLSVNLRAEHLGGRDRIYTIYVEVTDASGNKSTTTTTVTVPLHAPRRR